MSKERTLSGWKIGAIVILTLMGIAVMAAIGVIGFTYIKLNQMQRIDETDVSAMTSEEYEDYLKKQQQEIDDPVDPNDSSTVRIENVDGIIWSKNPNSPFYKNDSKQDSKQDSDGSPSGYGSWYFPSDYVTNILLIGLDLGTRTDTMILISHNYNTNVTTMVSFLRDNYIYIPGYGPQRLNEAYNVGGLPLLDETFRENFGITIDGHVMVDFDSFPQIVDAIGGVTLWLDGEEAETIGVGTEDGNYTLYGDKALLFCRLRSIDNDFYRTSRQRRFLNAIVDNLGWVGAFNAALSVVDYCYTDMSTSYMMSFGTTILGGSFTTLEQVPSWEGEFYNAVIYGMMVLVPDLDMAHDRLYNALYN